jgi:hypothetical protein
MLTKDDLTSLAGVTVAAAEIRDLPGGGRYLRLRLAGGGILAISPNGDDLTVTDESAMP